MNDLSATLQGSCLGSHAVTHWARTLAVQRTIVEWAIQHGGSLWAWVFVEFHFYAPNIGIHQLTKEFHTILVLF